MVFLFFVVVLARGLLFWIPVGLLSALVVGSREPGACWGPMVRNRGCSLTVGVDRPSLRSQSPEREMGSSSAKSLSSSFFSCVLWWRVQAAVATGAGAEFLREGWEGFSVAPHAVQQHGQLASDRDHGALLAALASAGGQAETPAAQRRVRPEAAQEVVGCLHQQAAQAGVAGPRVTSSNLGCPVGLGR